MIYTAGRFMIERFSSLCGSPRSLTLVRDDGGIYMTVIARRAIGPTWQSISSAPTDRHGAGTPHDYVMPSSGGNLFPRKLRRAFFQKRRNPFLEIRPEAQGALVVPLQVQLRGQGIGLGGVQLASHVHKGVCGAASQLFRNGRGFLHQFVVVHQMAD